MKPNMYRRFALLAILAGALPLAAQVATQTALTVAPNQSPSVPASLWAMPEVLTATVTDLSGNPVLSGAVTFTDSTDNGAGPVTNVLGVSNIQHYYPGQSLPAGANGRAVLYYTFGPGPHSLTASYLGTTAATSAGIGPWLPSSNPTPVILTDSNTLPATFHFTYSYGYCETNPAQILGLVAGYGPQVPTGTVTLTDSTTGTPIPESPYYASPISYVPFFAGQLSDLSPGIGSFFLADFANTGTPGLVALYPTRNKVLAAPIAPNPTFLQNVSIQNSMTTGWGDPLQFTGQPMVSVANAPVQAVAADLNGQGFLDIVIAHNDAAVGVGILRNDTTGKFTAPEVSYPNFGAAAEVAVGDVNGDGLPDIVVANGGNQVAFLLNDGTGGFSPGGTAAVGDGTNGATQLALTDINGDGIPDIVVLIPGAQSVGILFGNGDGTFQNQVEYPAGPSPAAFAVADLNQDGIPDIAVVGVTQSDVAPYGKVAAVTFLYGQGAAASYQLQTPYTELPYPGMDLVPYGASAAPVSIAATDLNGDGTPDLAIGFNVGLLAVATYAPTFYNANPSGFIYWTQGYPLMYYNTVSLAVADLMGTGLKAILLGQDAYGDLDVVLGTNYMTPAPAFPFNGAAPPASQTIAGTFTPATGSEYTGPLTHRETLTLGAAMTVTVSPPAVSLGPSQTQQFAATVAHNTCNFQTVSWSVPSGVGSVTPDGLYTAPASITATTTVTVVATSGADSSKTGSAVITLNPAPPVASLSANSLAFGNQPVGTTSAPQTVTVTNTGGSNLVFGASDLSPASPTGYTIASDTCVGQAVVPNASCAIAISFSPTATGPRQVTLSLTGNAGTQPIALSGTGTAPVVFISANPVAFGSVLIGNTGPFQTITIFNEGTANLIFPLSELSPANPPGFSILSDNCAGATLAPTNGCAIRIVFAPTTKGPQQVTLSLIDNAGNSPQSIVLTGTGAGSLALPASTTLTFGNQLVGSTSPFQTVVISNAGTGNINFAASELSPASPPGYAISGDNCAGMAMAPGKTCAIQISFSPTTAGAQPVTLSVISDASDSPQTISLSGTGTMASNANAKLTPASLTFGNQGIGSTGSPASVIVTNTGSGPLTFAATAVNILGLGASSFRQQNTCQAATLQPNATCEIDITFVPTAAGTLAATLNIYDNAPGSPQAVPVSGSGVTPTLSLSAPSLSFGNVAKGTSSAPQTLTIANTGVAGLFLGAPTLTGANPGAFSFTKCTVPAAGIAAGGTCQIAVTFTPAALGAATATLNLVDYAAGAPQQIALSGTGTGVTTITPTSLSFGSVSVGTTSAEQAVSAAFTGGMIIHSVTIGGANASSYNLRNTCPLEVTVTNPCAIYISFAPASAVPLAATLSVADDSPGSPQTVTLTGTGVTGPVNDTPSVQIISTALVYNRAQQTYSTTFTVKNTGPIPLNAPLYLVLTNFPAQIGAINAAGKTNAGAPYYILTAPLNPGASESVPVIVTDPAGAPINGVALVYSGPIQ